jgi:hypothetical protein
LHKQILRGFASHLSGFETLSSEELRLRQALNTEEHGIQTGQLIHSLARYCMFSDSNKVL